jgi:hypothetical protein
LDIISINFIRKLLYEAALAHAQQKMILPQSRKQKKIYEKSIDYQKQTYDTISSQQHINISPSPFNQTNTFNSYHHQSKNNNLNTNPFLIIDTQVESSFISPIQSKFTFFDSSFPQLTNQPNYDNIFTQLPFRGINEVKFNLIFINRLFHFFILSYSL